jgi:hypothetical protein
MIMCNECHYSPCKCDELDEGVYTAADLAVDIEIILADPNIRFAHKLTAIGQACWAARHPEADPFEKFANDPR